MTSTLTRRPCVGVGMLAPVAVDNAECHCPMCNRVVRIRDDGGVSWHPMDYARWLATMAEVFAYDRMMRGLWPY